jgi:hypothetical protein
MGLTEYAKHSLKAICGSHILRADCVLQVPIGRASLTFSTANPILVKIKAGFVMSIESRDTRKVGIWFLLLAFVFAAIILPLLSADAPDALTAVTFTLLLILEILFVFSLNPQLIVCTGSRFGISPRSPPIC